jgi:DNA-binding transcriptional MerR regulator
MGFTLPELATILKMRDRGDAPCHRVRAIAEHKLEQVKQQINDLIGMRNQVERILKDWDALLARTGNGKQARLLESLPHDVIGTNSRRLTAKHLRRSQR